MAPDPLEISGNCEILYLLIILNLHAVCARLVKTSNLDIVEFDNSITGK